MVFTGVSVDVYCSHWMQHPSYSVSKKISLTQSLMAVLDYESLDLVYRTLMHSLGWCLEARLCHRILVEDQGARQIVVNKKKDPSEHSWISSHNLRFVNVSLY